MPNFDDGANCFDNISHKQNLYGKPQQEPQNSFFYLPNIFYKDIFDLMSLINCDLYKNIQIFGQLTYFLTI